MHHPKPQGQSSSGKLSVLQFNARSLLPKKSELAHSASFFQRDFIAISETWLDNSVPDGAFLTEGYCVALRADRKDDRDGHGGVLILSRSEVQCSPRKDLCFWPESAWIEVSTCHPTVLLHPF